MRRNLTIKDIAIFHCGHFKEFEIKPQPDGTLIVNANLCNTKIAVKKGFFGELHLSVIDADEQRKEQKP